MVMNDEFGLDGYESFDRRMADDLPLFQHSVCVPSLLSLLYLLSSASSSNRLRNLPL